MGHLYQVMFVCFLGVAQSSGAGPPAKCKNGVKCIIIEECRGVYIQLQKKNPLFINLVQTLHCGFGEGGKPKICCPNEYLDYKLQDILPDTSVCGIQNSDRIVGGSATTIDEHPWMALLGYDKPNGKGFYCGGVIISERYILTAAHCVKGAELPKTWKLSHVRLGEWDMKMDHDCQGNGPQKDCSPDVVEIPIEELITHESYNPMSEHQQYDIALLRVAHNINFSTDFVKPICLPLTPLASLNDTFQGINVEVAGWGKTELRSASDVKLKVRLPIVTNKDCQDVYKQANRNIFASQICAGGMEGEDSCRGDSGGPLMSMDSAQKNWMAIGVVSYGPSPCGSKGWPGVYTRVTSYVDWIKSKIRL